jgi:hypothetical protein
MLLHIVKPHRLPDSGVSRPPERNRDVFHNGTGSGTKDENAVGKIDGLIDIVRHK